MKNKIVLTVAAGLLIIVAVLLTSSNIGNVIKEPPVNSTDGSFILSLKESQISDELVFVFLTEGDNVLDTKTLTVSEIINKIENNKVNIRVLSSYEFESGKTYEASLQIPSLNILQRIQFTA